MTGLVLAAQCVLCPPLQARPEVSEGLGDQGQPGSVLRVVEKGSFVPIEDAGYRYGIGDMIPMFQRSGNYFIGVHKPSYGPNELCAVPRIVYPNKPTAWISNNRLIIFGERVTTIQGKFFFYLGEELEILERVESGYRVALEREGYVVPVTVPFGTQGLRVQERVAGPGPAKGGAGKEATEKPEAAPPLRVMPVPQPVEKETATAKAPVKPGSGRVVDLQPMLDVAINKQAPVPASPETTEVAAQPEESDAAPVQAQLALEGSPPVVNSPKAATDPFLSEEAVSYAPSIEVVETLVKGDSTAEASFLNIVEFLERHTVTSQLLLVVCILEAVFYSRLKRRARMRAEQEQGEQAEQAEEAESPGAVEAAAEAVESPPVPPVRDTDDLHGSLGGFDIGQVIQFFHSSAETGVLIINGPNGHQPDKLTFREGQIVDARSEGLAGESAAKVILRRQLGKFSFKREKVEESLNTVQRDTMSLLLECHRLIDEEGYAEKEAAQSRLVDFMASVNIVGSGEQVVGR